MNRALLWLVGGVVVLALAVLAIAPELLADLETAGSAVGIALAAVVPATMVAVLFVSTRRRRDRRDRRDRASDDDRHPDRSDLGG
jgi:membrane protein implicated in regulation of membrane protease activity